MLTSKPVFSLVNERLSLGIMNGPDKIQCIVFFCVVLWLVLKPGTVERQNSGTPKRWNTGKLGRRNATGTPEYRNAKTGIQDYKNRKRI